MKSQHAIDWKSPTMWGLVFIQLVSMVGVALWATGILVITWEIWLLTLCTYAGRVVGVGAGYHRYFTHQAYRFRFGRRPFQAVLAFLSQTAAQGGVIDWAETHGDHHRFADRKGDPHSPLLGGFWWAHIGWLIAARKTPVTRLERLRRFPELSWLNRWHALSPIALAATCLAVGGWMGLLFGFFVSTFALLHSTFLVDSGAHLWGYRRYNTPDTSRNNWWIALLTFGEGWHNNHHHRQGRANQGERWYEVDITYYWLCFLETIRLIKINRPRKMPA